MHGSILHGLKRFVIQRDGQDTWESVVREARAGGWYHTTRSYDDEEMIALVGATAGREGRSTREVLEEFGASIVPSLLALYGAFVSPEWKTLDLLLHTETVIHRTVRLREPAAHPPRLRVARLGEHAVEIIYTSQRRLCAVAVGICHGVAAHYGQEIEVEQRACMERGDDACRIVVSLR